MVLQAPQVAQVLLAKMALLEQVVHPAHQVKMVHRVLQEKTDLQVHPVHQEQVVLQELPVLQ
jgi:hypothetical protein